MIQRKSIFVFFLVGDLEEDGLIFTTGFMVGELNEAIRRDDDDDDDGTPFFLVDDDKVACRRRLLFDGDDDDEIGVAVGG